MTLTAIHLKKPFATSRLRVEQKRSVTRGHEVERFIWDGLALVHRDGSDYLNEPAVGGGNPIASGGQVMFNDMLGSTVAVKGDESYSLTSMTAFGESSDTGAFFTGKPFIGEIGYAFLMRSYRPEHGKWQTADPIGYPDGWNNLAYCNNGVTSCLDLFGASRIEFKYEGGSRYGGMSGIVLDDGCYYRLALKDEVTAGYFNDWSTFARIDIRAEGKLQKATNRDATGALQFVDDFFGGSRWDTSLYFGSAEQGDLSILTTSSNGFNYLLDNANNQHSYGYVAEVDYTHEIAWNKKVSNDGYFYGRISVSFNARGLTFSNNDKKASFTPSSQVVATILIRKEE